MNRNIRKLICFIFLLMLFSANHVSAAVAPSLITLGGAEEDNVTYIGKTYFSRKKLADGTWAYCLDHDLDTPNSGTATKRETPLDGGFVYIIENGYPNKSFTGDYKKDYYITQVAMWWYMDLVAGVSDSTGTNLSPLVKSGGTDSYNIRQYVKKLAYDAYANRNNGQYNPSYKTSVSSTSMTLSSDKKYYVSDLITHSGNKNTGSYTVDTASLPSGTVLLDSNGNQVTEKTVKGSFKIKVPVSSLSFGKNNINVKVTSSASYSRAYAYDHENATIQDVAPAIIYSEPTTLSSSVALTADVSTGVYVSKIDSSTGNRVAGAELVIKDFTGKVVKTIISEETKTYISDLPPGTYTLQETKAPAGYSISTNINTFKVEIGEELNISISDAKTEVKISKQDITTKNELKGAHLVLRDKDQNIIEEWDSTNEPHYIYGLVAGETYTLEETIAPVGYYLATEKVSFIVRDDGTVNEIIMNNSPTKVIINKLDIKTKDYLSGASLIIRDIEGNIIDEWESSDESHIIYGLEIGKKYILEEKEAPENYSKAESIEFEVLSDKETVVDMYDSELVKVPDTGISKSIIWICVGTLLVVFGVGTIIYVKKQKEV